MNENLISKNTFYMQYTALMLIIITFIVGTFLHPNFLNNNKEKKLIEAKVISQSVVLNINESLDDFIQNIPIYSKLLKEHNIKGEINLNFNKRSNDENLITLEDEIKLRFKNENINKNAFNIFVKEGDTQKISFKIIRTNHYDL